MVVAVVGMVATELSDDEHVDAERERYRARRDSLRGALVDTGFTIDHSEAVLYLWATRGEASHAAGRRLHTARLPGV